jgi:DNA mismatch repair protein MutS2
MKNIGQMLQDADENSLILLDELGSGTDPQEGGAIAMAILDEFIARNSFVILTTHHGILKNYGYTHPQCQNASVDFNPDTLSPTYKIVMGVPGESHALDIAKRNGISEQIIQKACSYIENKQADVSTLIKGLTEKYKEISELEKSIKAKENTINEKWRKVDLKELRVKQHEFELKEQGYKKSKDFLDESQKMLENLVRELREGEITREKTLKVKETIANLSKAVELENQSLEEAEVELDQISKDKNPSDITKDVTEQKSEFQEGQKIRFGKNKTEGILLQKQKNDKWLIQSGSVKLTIKESDIVQVASSQMNNKVSIEIVKAEDEHKSRVETLAKTGATSIFSEKPVFELRLLGMRYEQAIKAVEKQLDLCVINNFKNFSIIHGKGNGVLQTAVWDYLKTYPGIASFHFANPEDGGTGKTYVTLE